MDYIFGTEGDVEVVKTKGCCHSDLTGWQETTRVCGSETITDRFHVVKKYASTVGVDGACYDFYEIDRHYRTVDRTASIREQQAQDRADIEYIAMETGVGLDAGTEEEEDGRYEAF